ncbi:hypothetical protein Gotur_031615, partial [Gossypium turneri]
AKIFCFSSQKVLLNCTFTFLPSQKAENFCFSSQKADILCHIIEKNAFSY